MEIYKEYWTKIFYHAIKGAWKFLGLGGILIEFFIGIVASYFILNLQSCSEIGLREIMITAAVIIGVYTITIAFFIFKIPPEIDKSINNDLILKEEELEELKNKISRKNIKAVPDRIIKSIVNNNNNVRVAIENDSGKELCNYFNRIETIIFQDENGEKELLFPPNMEFHWPGIEPIANSDMKPIASKKRAEISIATTFHTVFKFDTIKSTEKNLRMLSDIGIYRVILLVGGSIGGVGVNNTFQIVIEYKGGNKIEIIEFKEFDGD